MKKPRYHELRERITELERELLTSRQAEEVLREREESYRDLYENAPNAYFSISTHDGSILRCNSAALRLLGYERETLLRMNVFDLYGHTPNGKAKAREVFRQFKAGESVSDVELQMQHKQGYPIWISLSVDPVRDRDGNITESRSMVIDISERKRAEEKLAWELKVNSALSELYEPLADPGISIEDVAKVIFDKAKLLTGSEHGYVSSVDPATGDSVVHTLTEMLKDQCRVSEQKRKTVFPRGEDGLYPGLWGHSLNSLKAFFTNSPKKHKASIGIPEGHVPIRRFLSVPAILGEELVGQIALANKDEDYREQDLEVVRRLAVFYALAIQRVRTEEALRKARGELEQRVEERTAELSKANLVLKREVAQRKEAEEALRETEEKYRSLVESTEDSIYLLDRSCAFLFANQKQLSRLGLAADKVLGKRYSEFHSEDDSKELVGKIEETFETGKSLQHEHRSRRDGRYFLRTLSPIKKPDGVIISVMVISKDITEHKLAEQALRRSEEKYRTLFEQSKDGIFMTSLEGNLLDINQSGLDLFGYAKEEVMGLSTFDIYAHPKDRQRFQQEIEQRGFVTDFEVTFRKKNGNEIDCLLSSTVSRADDRSIVGYQGIVRDITETKEVEEHIRRLSQQLLKAQEIERQKLSCDLHDNLAQDLSTLKIGIDTLLDDQPDVSSEKRQRVSNLSEMIRRIITDIRDLAYDLHPGSLGQVGLAQTAHRFCEEFSASNSLKVDFSCVGLDKGKLDFDTEIAIYRLIQEGLTNIKKHADATRASVRLVSSHPNILLRIEDNGKGFEVKKRLDVTLKEKRMGLWSMEQRSALLDGKMEINSRPGHGTKIQVEIPWKERRSAYKEDRLDY